MLVCLPYGPRTTGDCQEAPAEARCEPGFQGGLSGMYLPNTAAEYLPTWVGGIRLGSQRLILSEWLAGPDFGCVGFGGIGKEV